MDIVVEDVLRGASAEGRLPELLDAVADARPHRPDLRELGDDIRSRPTLTRAPSPWRGRADYYAHVALPPNFVPRPELLAEARDILLSGDAVVGLTSAVKMDALHGMGGIGKGCRSGAVR